VSFPFALRVWRSSMEHEGPKKEAIVFVVLLHYLQPLSVVESFLPAHRGYLDRHYAAGHFLTSGAQFPRTGGVILAKQMAREKLEAILAEDPFQREEVASYQIVEFTPSKFAPGTESFFS
jgi:uncharacterized protein YciI